MYKVRKKSKGLTVLELMLALAIGAMFIAIFFQFFLIHQKALNSTAVKSQLQMDMQQIMESFTQSAMEASGISDINGVDPKTQSSNSAFSKAIDINSDIIFTVNDIEIYNNYSIDNVNKISVQKESSTIGKTLSSNLSNLNVIPIGGTGFSDCGGITVDIQLLGSDGKTTYSASNSIYFRNKN